MIHHIRRRLHKHGISFKHAFDGVVWAFKTQPNYQIHLALSFISIFGGLFFHISQSEFLMLALLITMGLAIETINTAIEKTADAVTTEYNEHIKIAKDVAAGAMLIFAMGAFVVACVIFVPKIMIYLTG